MYLSFRVRWIGKYVDYDGVFDYQCVDLIKMYLFEVYGIRSGAWGDAIDYANKPHKDFLASFARVSTPQQGDIVVFSGGKFGHIGIVNSFTNTDIVTLEQNGATGDGDGKGGDEIRIRSIPKARVVAYYRYKKEVKKVDMKGGTEVANAAQVNNIYKAILHREGDPGGVQTYTGRDANAIVSAMLNSAEFQAHQNFINTASQTISDQLAAIRGLSERPTRDQLQQVLSQYENARSSLSVAQSQLEEAQKNPTVVEKEVIKEVEPTWLRATIDFIRKILRIS